jgi:hypothetical protein
MAMKDQVVLDHLVLGAIVRLADREPSGRPRLRLREVADCIGHADEVVSANFTRLFEVCKRYNDREYVGSRRLSRMVSLANKETTCLIRSTTRPPPASMSSLCNRR